MIESRAAYEAFLDSDDLTIRRRATTDEATADVWFEILEHDPDLAVEVAFNKKLPDSVIEFLIQHDSEHVRHIIATKRRLRVSQFETLASDEDESVRSAIAFNKKAPLIVLEKLALDPCERVSSNAKAQIFERRPVS